MVRDQAAPSAPYDGTSKTNATVDISSPATIGASVPHARPVATGNAPRGALAAARTEPIDKIRSKGATPAKSSPRTNRTMRSRNKMTGTNMTTASESDTRAYRKLARRKPVPSWVYHRLLKSGCTELASASNGCLGASATCLAARYTPTSETPMNWATRRASKWRFRDPRVDDPNIPAWNLSRSGGTLMDHEANSPVRPACGAETVATMSIAAPSTIAPATYAKTTSNRPPSPTQAAPRKPIRVMVPARTTGNARDSWSDNLNTASEAPPQTDEACVVVFRRLRRTPAAAPLRGTKPPS